MAVEKCKSTIAEKRTRLVVVQATPLCNIDCSYCYLQDRNNKKKISFEVLASIVDRLLEWGKFESTVTVLWHAGEPLVLDADFYERALSAFDRLKELGIHVEHAIQTNATLVTSDHCELFKARDVTVGISSDGPAYLHNLHRKDRNGRGTFERAMAGLSLFQKYSIYPSAIAVITKESLNYPTEFYEHFVDRKIGFVGLNVEEVEGANSVSTILDQKFEHAFKNFLTKLFDMSLSDGRVVFRDFLSIVGQLVVNKTKVNSEVSPGAILSFSSDGSFSTYSPELLDTYLRNYSTSLRANIALTSIAEYLDAIQKSDIGVHILQGVDKCKTNCMYFGSCGGGSPSNKVSEYGSFAVSETKHCCYSRKAVVDVICDLLREPAQTKRAVDQVQSR